MTYRKTLPQRFDLVYNILSKCYQIEENGIVYSMQLEHTRLLKKHFGTIADWYKKLDNETKKEIIRTGNIPKDKDDFYPDTLPEDL